MDLLKQKLAQLHPKDTHPELPLDPDVSQPGVYKWPPYFTPALVLVVFIGGCFGTAARYWVSQHIISNPDGWPTATLFGNLLGAFLLGLLLEGLVRLGADNGARRIARLGVGTGFMGAFTTYSTLAVETNLLFQHSHFAMAAGYAAASLFGGVLCGTLGIQLAAIHHKRRENKQ